MAEINTDNKTFVLSEEDKINSYGFRVLTKGIDLTQFKKNPVMLFNHIRGGSDYKGPIGRWENIRVENNQLKADAVFDDDDDTGSAVKRKVQKGFIKGVSLGLLPIETSTDPKHLLPGQKWPTVIKCKAVEGSVCDIPSNDNALALYDAEGNIIELTGDGLVKLNAFLPQNNNLPPKTMDKIELSLAQLTILGLTEKSTEADVTRSLAALNQKATEYDALKLKYDGLETKLNSQRDAEITELVDKAEKEGRIKPATRNTWITVLKQDFDNGKALLGAVPAPVQLTSLAGKKTPTTTGGAVTLSQDEWGYDDYAKNGKLAKLKADEPEKYEALLAEKKEAVRLKVKISQ